MAEKYYSVEKKGLYWQKKVVMYKLVFQVFFGTPHGQTDKHQLHWVFYAILHILRLMNFQRNTTATINGGMP
jgi:hypothetical protein